MPGFVYKICSALTTRTNSLNPNILLVRPNLLEKRVYLFLQFFSLNVFLLFQFFPFLEYLRYCFFYLT